eukprot:m.75598 g.75598  ORF g.75598 m.75598 type:complete len:379 (-) comp20528_c0_seq1:158-1294(-)
MSRTMIEEGSGVPLGHKIKCQEPHLGNNKKRVALATLTNQPVPAPSKSQDFTKSCNENKNNIQKAAENLDGMLTRSRARQQRPLKSLQEELKTFDSLGAESVVDDFIDIDRHKPDPFSLREYVGDIYTYFQAMEHKFRPKISYMKKQKDINHSMRTILVDWLVEVAEEYRLSSQSLYISVIYIDRFLSEMSVQRGKLQLVGVTCMLLAAKFEEIYPPAIDEFVYITDHTYTRDQILRMEHLVLKVLKFDMGPVTILNFLQRFTVAAHADERTGFLIQYLAELTLQDGEKFMKYIPSIVACAAVCVGLNTMQKPCWTSTLTHYTKYTREDIQQCVLELHKTFVDAPKCPQQAVREKYSHSKTLRVSNILASPTPPPLSL